MVDDDEEHMLSAEDLFREGLKGVSLQFDKANSAPGALQFVENCPFDLILLDYQLGDLTGLDLLRDLRAQGNHTPVVLLTGRGDEQIAAEAMKPGAADYLPKAKLTPNLACRSARYVIELHEKETLSLHTQQQLRQRNRQLESISPSLSPT